MDEFFIGAIDLTTEEKEHLQGVMAESHGILSRCATKRYGTPNIKRLRYDYHKGRYNFLGEGRAESALLQLKDIETQVVKGYIKSVFALCRAFHHLRRKSGQSLTDFVQEAAWRIADCIYQYDGSTEFTTFVYKCVKNRLMDFVRSEHRTGRVSGGSEESLHLEEVQQPEPTSVVEDTLAIQAAVQEANLTEQERMVMDAFLTGERGYQTRLAKESYNPETGKPYTKAAISLVFQRACRKIRLVYNLRFPELEAA